VSETGLKWIQPWNRIPNRNTSSHNRMPMEHDVWPTPHLQKTLQQAVLKQRQNEVYLIWVKIKDLTIPDNWKECWVGSIRSIAWAEKTPSTRCFPHMRLDFGILIFFFDKKIYNRWVWDGISSFKILANTASLLSGRHRWIGKLNYWLSNWLGMTWTRDWNNTCKILETVLQYTIYIYIIVIV